MALCSALGYQRGHFFAEIYLTYHFNDFENQIITNDDIVFGVAVGLEICKYPESLKLPVVLNFEVSYIRIFIFSRKFICAETFVDRKYFWVKDGIVIIVVYNVIFLNFVFFMFNLLSK